MLTHGVFVTGTDTDVGKTVTAACLVWALGADYWKPVQTGRDLDDDAATVADLTGLPPDRIHPSTYSLLAPLSPHAAAGMEGVTIRLDTFMPPPGANPLVVEGAGGVLVPLNERHLMVDLMVLLGLPVVLVARSTLGTINHTLLSLEALRQRKLTVAGVILNGPPNPSNRHAIETYGRIPILGEIPPMEPIDALTAATVGASLRNAVQTLW
ncbi:MAG: dethiobiotin synthase [Alphaproteobacteria bacterium]|nr:dethiobiotin synthase [Alphaproteobacteria bacterium]